MQEEIIISSNKKYLIQGVYLANPRGFGFIRQDDPDLEDIYVSEKDNKSAMHGDTVEAVVKSRNSQDRHSKGRITKILKRGTDRITGTYRHIGVKAFVFPDNAKFTQNLLIPAENDTGTQDGSKVIAEIVSYGDRHEEMRGRVIEVLGAAGDPGVDILSLIREYGLPEEFDDRLLRLASNADRPVRSKDCEGRLDLRSLAVITIDGEDAKDLDDGISLVMSGNTFKLGVHIADVSNYVKERSLLDKEAQKRGTSVYLADRVIPMLPPALSNGICSLNEGKDRLALSCLMTIDETGKVIDHEIRETVINVRHRMSYNEVKGIVTDKNKALADEYSDMVPMLQMMIKLSSILRSRRGKRGSIDFDFPETKLLLDEKGVPTDILPYERNAATDMIEDFMLLANETVAEDFYWQEIPFVYRTHDSPDPEKMRDLNGLLSKYGYVLHSGGGEIHPGEVQKLLSEIEGKPEEAIISRITLRAMKQARYTTECTGHFGLASKYYCHFTSPIRRYPDLQIHRIIKETLNGKMDARRRTHYEKLLPDIASQCSILERRADEAERDTLKMKIAEYMKLHIGKKYTGIVSGVTDWGIYVELPNTAEGLVHVTKLKGDFYEYKEAAHELTGKHTGKTYRLGDTVHIKVSGADTIMHTVDFDLCEE